MLAALAGLTFLMILGSSFSFWGGNQQLPPHELRDTRVEPSVVTPDEKGILKVKLFTGSIRRLPCYVQIYRTFANATTNEIVYQTVMIGGRVTPDGKPTEFPFEMELPAARFPPGRYSYTAYAMNKCPENQVYTVPADMSYFEVAPRATVERN